MMESVVVGGRTFLTVAGLVALAPTHPLLDKEVRFSNGKDLARNHPDMLIAELGR